jgi:hypothetical protein
MVKLEEVTDETFIKPQPVPSDDEWDTDDGTFNLLSIILSTHR